MSTSSTDTTFLAPINQPSVSPRRKALVAMTARLRGPGGYYNIGNLFGLMTGLGLQISQASQGTSVTAAAVDFLAGSVSGLALTAATLVFMFSGEAYHHAWANGFPPIGALNKLGDLLSGVGALALGVGLLMLGQPVLALTSGLLHAVGKFGSAFYGSTISSGFSWPKAFRSVVLASRVPAMAAALIELSGSFPQFFDGASIAPVLASGSLLLCYALWARADLLLFKG